MMRSQAMLAICIFSVFVIITVASKKREQYVEQPGMCNCCDCGWMDCQKCQQQTASCCQNFDYDRYTYS